MKLVPIVLAAALTAGAASAQPLVLRFSDRASAPVVAVQLAGQPAKAIPDLANPLDPLARPVLQPGAMQSAVFAKTALDHRFARNSDLSGSVGFLCGLQPGQHTGGGAAYGVDPHGRFVGARFSIAFK
jgi:hypothetical protein